MEQAPPPQATSGHRAVYMDIGIWATLTILNLIWNLSPSIACSIVIILWETPLFLFNDQVQWMTSQY